MFGTLRVIFACMVLVCHLTDQYQIGTYAVFGFYIISGYLMTHIMHESYGYNINGRISFFLNRFLRLYPTYWVVIILSVLIIGFVGEDISQQYNKVMTIPSDLTQWLSVLTMLYIAIFPNEVAPNLAPATWAISVELFYYFCICIGASKTIFRVYIWLAVSIAYIAILQAKGLNWPYYYFPVPAASLPFAIGALIYFRKKEGFAPISEHWITSPAFLTTLFVAHGMTTLVYPDYFTLGFYVSLFISILLCYELAIGREWTLISKKLDKAIGDYSYPIYLLHWQIGVLVCYMLYGRVFTSPDIKGYAVSATSLCVCILLSWLLIKFIDKPIQKLKARKPLI